jgi:hypothetical protein
MSELVPKPHIKLNITNSNPPLSKNEFHPIAIKLNIRGPQPPPSSVRLRIVDSNTNVPLDETHTLTDDSNIVPSVNLEQLSNVCELLPLPKVNSRDLVYL